MSLCTLRVTGSPRKANRVSKNVGMSGRIWRVLKNELKYFIHDRRSIALFIFGPMVVIALFGAAASNELTLTIAVIDEAHGEFSSRIVHGFLEQKNVEVKQPTSADEADQMLNDGKVDAIVLIPPDFDSKLNNGQGAELKVVVDNASPSIPEATQLVVSSVLRDFSKYMSTENVSFTSDRISFAVEQRYGGKFVNFDLTAPVLLPVIAMWFAMATTSLAIVGEHIRGTLTRLMKTPIRKLEIVVGKVLAGSIISLIQVLSVLVIAVWGYGLTLKGNLGVAFVTLFLAASVGLCWGIVISIGTKDDKQATEAVTLSMLLLMILGGVFFPTRDIPEPLHSVARLLPLEYGTQAARAILLRGSGIADVSGDLIMLVAWSALAFLLALVIFRFSSE